MHNLFNRNGLIFWNENDLRFRNTLVAVFEWEIRKCLKTMNRAFEMIQVETPLLMPRHLIHRNYTNEDLFITTEGLALRPETTLGSYLAATDLLNPHNDRKINLPICVWQHGRSFRNEQDNVLKNMRLKEFHQQEFQIFYSPSTANDYSQPIINTVLRTAQYLLHWECHLESSDRVPQYAEWTKDIICNSMEICSISSRTDYKHAKVLEVAIGTDRCVYQYNQLQ